MVSLIDLWVASMLPGCLLDLGFQIVATGAAGAVRACAPVDALLFARGFVAVASRELWWDDPADGALNGFRLQSIIVRPADPSPVPAPASPRPAARIEHRHLSVARLTRLLPHVAEAYPVVEWRSAAG